MDDFDVPAKQRFEENDKVSCTPRRERRWWGLRRTFPGLRGGMGYEVVSPSTGPTEHEMPIKRLRIARNGYKYLTRDADLYETSVLGNILQHFFQMYFL